MTAGSKTDLFCIRFLFTHTLCGGDEGNSETGGNTQRGSYGAQQPCWALSGLSGVCVHALVGFRV